MKAGDCLATSLALWLPYADVVKERQGAVLDGHLLGAGIGHKKTTTNS
jgi:hypothetical protein